MQRFHKLKYSERQGLEFAHSLIAHMLISLRSNERLWMIHSDHSGQICDREWFAQVAHDKWATVSDSLRSLMKNEQIANFLSHSLIPSFEISDMNLLLRFLTKNEWYAQKAQITHQKCVTMRNSFRSLTKNEWIARFFERINQLLIIRSYFRKKQTENLWIPNSSRIRGPECD